jgi:hypothetical protein
MRQQTVFGGAPRVFSKKVPDVDHSKMRSVISAEDLYHLGRRTLN